MLYTHLLFFIFCFLFIIAGHPPFFKNKLLYIFLKILQLFILNFLIHKTDSAFALASVYRIHFDSKIRLRQRNHALNLLCAF